MTEYTPQQTKELFMNYVRDRTAHEEEVRLFLEERDILTYGELFTDHLQKAGVYRSLQNTIRKQVNEYFKSLHPPGKTLSQIHQERRERQSDITERLSGEVADYFSTDDAPLDRGYVSEVISPAVKMNVTGYELRGITDGTNPLTEGGLADLLVQREGWYPKEFRLTYAPDERCLRLEEGFSRGLSARPKRMIGRRPQEELWEGKA